MRLIGQPVDIPDIRGQNPRKGDSMRLIGQPVDIPDIRGQNPRKGARCGL